MPSGGRYGRAVIDDPELVLADLGDDRFPDVAPPIRPTTTFRTGAPWTYRRSEHPGLAPIERAAARLDGGAEALAFSSGMGAIVTLLETLRPGARVVAPAVCYHGTVAWLEHLASRGAIDLTLVGSPGIDAWAAAVGGAVDLVWAEPIANPTWDVVDLEALAGVTRAADGVLVVDATATPLTTHPIGLGAHAVVHSGSKAYNGHSDVHAGIVVVAEAGEWPSSIGRLRSLMGTILQPWDAWLLRRGMQTMTIRVDRASGTAAELARRLVDHPAVVRVRYPGLADHPGHDIAARQMDRGFGSMLSIDLPDFTSAARVVASVGRWTPATSLGGVESLIEHRITVEPAGSQVPPGLLRLSVGLEPPDLLWDDLDQALAP
jgi:cystathionine gamma-synthase